MGDVIKNGRYVKKGDARQALERSGNDWLCDREITITCSNGDCHNWKNTKIFREKKRAYRGTIDLRKHFEIELQQYATIAVRKPHANFV